MSEELERKAHKIANHYNKDEQVDILIEEMSELTKALLKNRRAIKEGDQVKINHSVQSIEEEIADVEIMLQQIVYLGDFENVDDIMEYKLDRQLERISKEE